MATLPPASAEIQGRRLQQAIRAEVIRDAIGLWPLLDRQRIADTFPQWLRMMSMLIVRSRGQSAAAAARTYQSIRARELGDLGSDRLIKLAPAPDPQWLQRALGYAGPGLLQRPLPARPELDDMDWAAAADAEERAQSDRALTAVTATAARIALDGGQRTTVDTALADPKARAWYRETDGNACSFCAMLASRGPVYGSQAAAGTRADPRFYGPGEFKVHNLCGCDVKPWFGGAQQLPDSTRRYSALWGSATGGLSGDKARNAFRRAIESRAKPGDPLYEQMQAAKAAALGTQLPVQAAG